jgi:peptidyl-prolyl cis-trans isomerase D
MLKIMRSHKFFSVFILGILTVALTVVFIFWGIGPQQNATDTTIATVNGRKIMKAEYERAYERTYRQAREVYKDEEEIEKLNLRVMVLNELIDRIVLLDAAENTGLKVTNEEIKEVISNEPAFQSNGVFDKSIYLRRLKLIRTNPSAFEMDLKDDLMFNKMRRMIGETAELSPEEEDMLKAFKGETGQIAQSFLYAKREKAVKEYVEVLKSRMDITVNKDFY